MASSIIDVAIVAAIYVAAGQGFAWIVVKGIFGGTFKDPAMKAFAFVMAIGWGFILPMFGIVTALSPIIERMSDEDLLGEEVEKSNE